MTCILDEVVNRVILIPLHLPKTEKQLLISIENIYLVSQNY